MLSGKFDVTQGDLDQEMGLGTLESESELDDEEPLVDPSTDIKADLAAVLEHAFNFPGTFAWSETYDIGSTPNPCLKINGLGVIGVPVSERDAKAIISRSNAVGTGGILWEMRSEDVHFINFSWYKWVACVVMPQVCDALGVSPPPKPGTLQCELHKLLIQEPGATCSSYSDDKRCSGNFGTISIILPSEFTGGQLAISYQGLTKEFDFGQRGVMSTSILGSYTGLTHYLKPVRAGYKVILCYNITYTSNSICPSLPDMNGPMEKLRHVLLSWKQAAAPPEQLAYILNHRYFNSKLSTDVLKGSDAHTLQHLLPIARSLHFQMYLANLELRVWGDVHHGYETQKEDQYNDYEWEDQMNPPSEYGRDLDPEDLELDEDVMEDIDEGMMRVVDLDGMPVSIPDLVLEREEHLLGKGLDDPVSTKPDEIKYEEYDGDSGCLTYIHRRTVLLLWPENEGPRVVVGDVHQYACDVLELSRSATPQGKESTLVDQLVDCCANQAKTNEELRKAICVLRLTAIRWKDVTLLLRAAKACRADMMIDIMGIEGFISGYHAFGFEVMKTLFSDVIMNDDSNLLRSQLVHTLAEAGLKIGDEAVRSWCATQQDEILRSLKMVTAVQVDWLIQQIKSRCLEFFCDVIVPQLVALNVGLDFFVPFLRQLYQDKDPFSPSALDPVLSQLVTRLCHSAPPFPVKEIHTGNSSSQDPDLDSNMELIKLAIETGNVDACSTVFASMRAVPRDGSLKHVISRFYPEMTKKLDSFLTEELHGHPAFCEFFQDAMVSLLENLPPSTFYRTATDDLKMLIVAVKRAGGASILKKQLSPRIHAIVEKSSDVMVNLIRLMASSLQYPESDTSSTNDLRETLSLCLSALIDQLDISRLQQTGHFVGRGHTELIELCFEVHIPSLCERLLLRLLDPPGIDVRAHISKALIPFVPTLQEILAKQGINYATQPFSHFFSRVMVKFVEVVLGRRPSQEALTVPPSELAGIECQDRCTHCRRLLSFFESEQKEFNVREAQKVRSHVEHQAGIAKALGITFTTVRLGSPHTLQILKPAGIALRIWQTRAQQGARLMDTFGDETRKILGNDCASVISALSAQAPQSHVRSSAQLPSTGTAISRPSVLDGQRKRTLSAVRGPSSLSWPQKRARQNVGFIDLTSPSPEKR